MAQRLMYDERGVVKIASRFIQPIDSRIRRAGNNLPAYQGYKTDSLPLQADVKSRKDSHA